MKTNIVTKIINGKTIYVAVVGEAMCFLPEPKAEWPHSNIDFCNICKTLTGKIIHVLDGKLVPEKDIAHHYDVFFRDGGTHRGKKSNSNNKQRARLRRIAHLDDDLPF